jgi:glycosyltransferase involved in cell wall biosynthesis
LRVGRRASPREGTTPGIDASERAPSPTSSVALNRVRILIFNWKDLAHPAAGGAEVFTEEVGRALVQRGHSVTLHAAAVAGRPEREVVEGVQIVRAGGRFGVYRAARRFWAREGRGSFDVVVDEINTRPFLAPRWLRGAPVVALIHQLAREIWSYETPFPLSALGRYVLEPWWLRAYRDVPAMTVSASSAASLRQHHGWRDVTLVPEGWTPHPVPDTAKEERPTIVFLGRLVAMKRPQHAIDAFRILRETFPAAQLWVIGDGPLHLDPVDGVTRFGHLARADQFHRLAAAHVLVATSVREGWGLNVSEAAACGTPGIGYAVPGLVDSLQASGGATVEPSPVALGEALTRFFEGSLKLEPRISTVPWPEVAEAVERRLTAVASD